MPIKNINPHAPVIDQILNEGDIAARAASTQARELWAKALAAAVRGDYRTVEAASDLLDEHGDDTTPLLEEILTSLRNVLSLTRRQDAHPYLERVRRARTYYAR